MRPRPKKQDDRIIGWHPVLEALEEGLELARVLIQRDNRDDRTRQLLSTLRARRIPVQRVPRERLDRITKKNHQGIIAFSSPITFTPIEELVQQGFESGQRVLLVVRYIQTWATSGPSLGRRSVSERRDSSPGPPRCSGQRGRRQNEFWSPAQVARGSSSDAARALRYLGQCGLERIGLQGKRHEPARQPCTDAACLVLGDEERGISMDSWAQCDTHVRINMQGKTGSLNVSVAGGIALHHLTSRPED